jgi:hypothetical protein
VEMSENWEEWGGIALELRRGVRRRVFGGGGSLGAFVALGVTLIRGRCWTCWTRWT